MTTAARILPLEETGETKFCWKSQKPSLNTSLDEGMKMKKIVLGLCCLLFSAVALGGEATVSWIAPTTCADGSDLSACPITGYNVEIQRDGGDWESVVLTESTATSYKIENLPPGIYAFRVSTLTFQGVASDPEVAPNTKTISGAKPNPPTGVTVQ